MVPELNRRGLMSDIDDVSALRGVTLQLQGTIASLRHELEEAVARGRASVQAAETRAAAETKQLRETIDAMRTEIDRLRFAHQAELTRQESAFVQERSHLREQVQLLRAQLEKPR